MNVCCDFFFSGLDHKEKTKKMAGVCGFSFGGLNVQTNHFFAANGNSSSSTVQDVGNAFVLPTSMRVVGLSWDKSNAHPGNFVLTIDDEGVIEFDIVGSSDYTPVEFDAVFATNSIVRLRARHSHGDTAFRSCLVTLYFEPIHSNLDPLGGRSLNVIPFGGNVSIDQPSLLRFGAEARTGVDANMNMNNVATMFTVPAPMRLYRVGYQKLNSTFDTTLQLYKNGQPLENGEFTLWDGRGVEDFPMPDDSPFRQLNAGDVIQLAFVRGINPGFCILTLYTTQGNQLAPPGMQ